MAYNPQQVLLYCQGTFSTGDPTPAQQQSMLASAAEISASGFGTVVLGQWHVHSNGDIFYNNSLLSEVSWTLNNIPLALKAGGTVTKVLITFGPFPGDFENIQNNLATFQSQMQAVLALPGIDGLDWDLEGDYDSYSALLETLTEWANDLNKAVTAPPYQDQPFWNALLQNTNSPGVQWWNLQCYGGADYDQWNTSLQGIVPNPSSFLVPGFKPSDEASPPTIQSPEEIQAQVATLKTSYPLLSGGFIWRYEDIAGQAAAYAQAIINGLNG